MRHNNQCFDTNHRMTAGQEVWIDVTELPRRKKKEKIWLSSCFRPWLKHVTCLSSLILSLWQHAKTKCNHYSQTCKTLIALMGWIVSAAILKRDECSAFGSSFPSDCPSREMDSMELCSSLDFEVRMEFAILLNWAKSCSSTISNIWAKT